MSSSENVIMIRTKKRLVERKKSPNNRTTKNKFQQLYDNYKTRQAKNEMLKQSILSEREKKYLTECTFFPKTTKLKKILNKKEVESSIKEEKIKNKNEKKDLINSNSNLENWIKRQNQWLENKNNKLNRRIVTETMKNMEKCIFEPQIQKVNKRTISNLKTETQKIIGKPDSYLNYIHKNRNFRKSKSNSRTYEYPITGDWKSPFKMKHSKINRRNDYDYTKHQLTERSFILKNKSNSNFNNNISLSISNKSLNSKEKHKMNIPISKININNLKADELYKMIYLKGKEKMNQDLKDYTDENIDKLFKGKEYIYFNKAMERIHTVLVNLNFDDEKDNKNEENPINIKK